MCLKNPILRARQFLKTLTTKRYTDGVKQRAWHRFPGKLWQRNYYEHIIRDETDLNGIRRYIVDNPARWMEDAENPEGFRPAPTDDAMPDDLDAIAEEVEA